MWQFEPINYASSPNPDGKDIRNTPEFAKHRKKVIISVIVFAVFIALFLILGVGGIALTIIESKENNRQLYQYYQDEANYITVTGTLDEFYYYSSDSYCFTLTDNGENVLSDKATFIAFYGDDVSKNNNFRRDVTIGKSQFTVTYSRYEFLGKMPVVAIYMDGKYYLDYETGKNNLLKYMEDRYL